MGEKKKAMNPRKDEVNREAAVTSQTKVLESLIFFEPEEFSNGTAPREYWAENGTRKISKQSQGERKKIKGLTAFST